MPSRSTSSRYGDVAITIHWASALAVILALIGGLAMANGVESTTLLFAHIALGMVVLLLTLLRIVWWAVADRRPKLPADQPAWQRLVAHIVHSALYVALLLMATSGIATVILSGAIPAILGGGGFPSFDGVLPRVVHGIMSRVLLGLLALHIGAALYHHFIRRDGLLARMGVGRA